MDIWTSLEIFKMFFSVFVQREKTEGLVKIFKRDFMIDTLWFNFFNYFQSKIFIHISLKQASQLIYSNMEKAGNFVNKFENVIGRIKDETATFLEHWLRSSIDKELFLYFSTTLASEWRVT